LQGAATHVAMVLDTVTSATTNPPICESDSIAAVPTLTPSIVQ
jgi:hypothetical protein